ncbi:uncharacterized protein LOC129722158 [Wyeomyia smithii]|uniref:uncharacterized protein LOC129722158 n=1 Tax=Wyeomyia smithii TaxID=174621 RepID=UPI0024681205|nr:uncharacterized protein LOC129722158 [Wyeomyia smithii]
MSAACIICNNSSEKSEDCLLFPFPDKDESPVLYQKYLTVCGLQEESLPNGKDSSELFICLMHFESQCFVDTPTGLTLRAGSMPCLSMERIEIEAYVDEDFQILDEYMPLFNIKQTKVDPDLTVDLTSNDKNDDETNPTVETLLVTKMDDMEASIEEAITRGEIEIKTEAPEADEDIPDPFGNVKPPADGRYCILCEDDESKNPSCKLYVFPRKVPKIYRKWMQAAGLVADHYKNHDIYSCQRHFPENGFFADGKFVQSWATPSLNLPDRKKEIKASVSKAPSATIVLDSKAGPSASKPTSPRAKVLIKSNPANRKNAEALNIDPDSYAQTFAKVVMELMPKTINYNGEDRPVTGTIVFQSNLF